MNVNECIYHLGLSPNDNAGVARRVTLEEKEREGRVEHHSMFRPF